MVFWSKLFEFVSENMRFFSNKYHSFRHKHEFESGRTSSVGNDILGFGVHGEVVNKPDPHNNKLDWVQIDRDCSKVILLMFSGEYFF